MKTNWSVAVSNEKVSSSLSVRRRAENTAAVLFAEVLTGSRVKVAFNTNVLREVVSPWG